MASPATTALGGQISALMTLARQAEPSARGRVYSSVADLVLARGPQLSEPERALARQILAILTHQVETEIRRALSLRLAGRRDAPHDLVLMLANDTISVAEPVLMASPVLTEADLVLVVRHASSAHHHVVARRPDLPPRASEALIEHANDNALTTLLANASARIPAQALRTLITRAEANPLLREPLVKRKDLPPDVVIPLYKMVSAVLKAHIAAHYKVDPVILEQDVEAARVEAIQALPEDSEIRTARLIDKFERSNALGPGFIVKALIDGQRDLFIHGFARLLKTPPLALRRLIEPDDIRPLALATRAIGIDRSVFLTIYKALYGADRSVFDPAQKEFLDDIFLRTPPQAARARLAKLGLFGVQRT